MWIDPVTAQLMITFPRLAIAASFRGGGRAARAAAATISGSSGGEVETVEGDPYCRRTTGARPCARGRAPNLEGKREAILVPCRAGRDRRRRDRRVRGRRRAGEAR